MIVVSESRGLRLVTQPDHARFAAQLLSLWRRAELSQHPRRELLIEAVREHDNGWREADAAPRLDPASGRPCDFRRLPGDQRRELWRRGVARFASQRPYVALLAAEHSRALHSDRRDEPGWSAYLDELEAQREELSAVVGLEAAQLAADYRWLEVADALSLAVCCDSTEPVTRGDLSASLQQGELVIEPFPLAGATTFEIPCRWISDRRYAGEKELASELGAARWQRLRVRCRQGPPEGGSQASA